MLGRRQHMALAVTAVLAAAAACTNHARQDSGRGAPAGSAARGFTLVASGGVLPQTSVVDRAAYDAGESGYDFRPMLADVEPVVSRADLALCHMDTVYGTGGEHSGYPPFKSPPQIAQGLTATGYDGCSTASSHALDDGAAGIRRTLDAMDEAGLKHAGTARSAAEAHSVTIFAAGPARVAHLSYTLDAGANPLPAGEPWAVSLVDEQRMISDARAARQAGADVVVVSVHWGTDWQDAPDEQQ
ncbi:CapA family protein, partial [Streptomyces broussonetiae]|uniref:CapA family protein n=1 Tax=Streptomyces broussonetiae TaxID=2686304 RepID=UPI0035E01B10